MCLLLINYYSLNRLEHSLVIGQSSVLPLNIRGDCMNRKISYHTHLSNGVKVRQTRANVLIPSFLHCTCTCTCTCTVYMYMLARMLLLACMQCRLQVHVHVYLHVHVDIHVDICIIADILAKTITSSSLKPNLS